MDQITSPLAASWQAEPEEFALGRGTVDGWL
jgi:hypothetical protein